MTQKQGLFENWQDSHVHDLDRYTCNSCGLIAYTHCTGCSYKRSHPCRCPRGHGRQLSFFDADLYGFPDDAAAPGCAMHDMVPIDCHRCGEYFMVACRVCRESEKGGKDWRIACNECCTPEIPYGNTGVSRTDEERN